MESTARECTGRIVNDGTILMVWEKQSPFQIAVCYSTNHEAFRILTGDASLGEILIVLHGEGSVVGGGAVTQVLYILLVLCRRGAIILEPQLGGEGADSRPHISAVLHLRCQVDDITTCGTPEVVPIVPLTIEGCRILRSCPERGDASPTGGYMDPPTGKVFHAG